MEFFPGGPPAYWSTLPLQRMHAVLDNRRIPVKFSSHSGTYVCNHVFYLARHEIAQSDAAVSCGLVHLPMMCEQLDQQGRDHPCLPLAMMTSAIESCLDVILSHAYPSRSGNIAFAKP